MRERAEKSGSSLEEREDGSSFIRIGFLNRQCLVRFPDGAVTYREGEEEVPLFIKIVILHYLNHSEGKPLAGRWINFRQLSGGETYYPAFVKRSQKPLLDFFADRLNLLEQAAEAMGGRMSNEGDRAVIIPVLPRVPIALIFWSGDEELPPDARILFDATIASYLPTEDVAVLSQETVFGLMKWVRTRGRAG